MATSLGTVYLNGCNYELAYDVLSQNINSNYSNVRFYGILHVTNNYVSWTRGSASVYTSGLISIGTYYQKGDHTLITRDFTLYHNDDGIFNSWISAELSTTFTSGNTGGTLVLTIPRISKPSCITWPNTTENVGPIGSTIMIHMNRKSTLFTHTVRYNWYNKSGIIATNVTDNCEWTIPNDFCNDIPSSNIGQGTIYVDTYNNDSFIGTGSVVFKTTVTNANPTFTNFTFADINSKTLSLTGNSQYNVNGYSTIRATITKANSAIANKGAIMNKYRFIIGNLTPKETNYSNTATINIDIEKSTSSIYNIYAIDSRNNSTLVTKLAIKEIAYNPISINKQNTIIERNNNIGSQAQLTLNGTIWNQSFGKVTNSIKSISYKFKKTENSEWIVGTTKISPTINSNGEFTFSGQIASDNIDTFWDIESSYNIQIIINDELSSTTVNLILNSAIPTLCMDKNGVGIMCIYESNKGSALQISGKTILDLTYPIGSIYISVNSTNPEILFGGIWSRWGNGKVPVGVDINQTEFNEVEKEGGEKTHTLTIEELPSHNHEINAIKSNEFPLSESGVSGYNPNNSGIVKSSTLYTGGGKKHNILQPYITCYMWKRIG